MLIVDATGWSSIRYMGWSKSRRSRRLLELSGEEQLDRLGVSVDLEQDGTVSDLETFHDQVGGADADLGAFVSGQGLIVDEGESLRFARGDTFEQEGSWDGGGDWFGPGKGRCGLRLGPFTVDGQQTGGR